MLTTAAKAAAAAPAAAGAAASLAGKPTLLKSAAIFGSANALGFGISAATGSHLHLDLIGTGVFAVAAVATAGADARQRCSAGAVALWAVKLSSFLFYRALQTQHDGRLTEILSTTSGAAGFWFISFAWGWVVSLPHTIAAGVPAAGRPRFGGPFDVLGVRPARGGASRVWAAPGSRFVSCVSRPRPLCGGAADRDGGRLHKVVLQGRPCQPRPLLRRRRLGRVAAPELVGDAAEMQPRCSRSSHVHVHVARHAPEMPQVWQPRPLERHLPAQRAHPRRRPACRRGRESGRKRERERE